MLPGILGGFGPVGFRAGVVEEGVTNLGVDPGFDSAVSLLNCGFELLDGSRRHRVVLLTKQTQDRGSELGEIGMNVGVKGKLT